MSGSKTASAEPEHEEHRADRHRREPHRVRVEAGLVEDHRLEEEVRRDVAEGVADLLSRGDPDVGAAGHIGGRPLEEVRRAPGALGQVFELTRSATPGHGSAVKARSAGRQWRCACRIDGARMNSDPSTTARRRRVGARWPRSSARRGRAAGAQGPRAAGAADRRRPQPGAERRQRRGRRRHRRPPVQRDQPREPAQVGGGPPRAGPLQLRARRPLRRARPQPRDVRRRARAVVAPADAGVGLRRRGREEGRPRDAARPAAEPHHDGRRPLPGPDRRLGRRQRGARRGRDAAETPWLEAIGEDYVAKAFEFAHEADPDAELYYNDYNLWKPAKRDAAIRLVQGLKAKGLRVDGIGEQGALGHRRPAAPGDRRRRSRRSARRVAAAHHRARHGRPAARPRHVGRRPLEEGEDPRGDEHLPRRAARRACSRSSRAATRTCSRCS